jgi:hypothetical protein
MGTTAPKSSASTPQQIDLATNAGTATNLDKGSSRTSLDIQNFSPLEPTSRAKDGEDIDGFQGGAVEMQDLQRELKVDNQPDRSESITNQDEAVKPVRGFLFWCIILGLCVTGILSALEGTIVSTALPTAVQDLGGAELYIWSVNGYFLARQAIATHFM